VAHTSALTIDWGDTDAGGLIYFPRFFHFAVVGLNDYFAPAMDGHLMESLRRDGHVLPAVDASGSFESPLRAGDRVEVETTVTRLGEASLTTAFDVRRAETAERAADETGDDDFRYVSSHDLRRRFAQRLLVDKQVNPRVVMQVGGWDSFAAIEPYLNAPTEDVVDEAFRELSL